jgi:alkanesulfonate monooxygenase SsuD/methylene tetrahydromethanopterin reductase-like flavin-dependent oxidoreductase (luciferase family)
MRFTSPAPWLLGSSTQSAFWAAELGLPYCFADFINPAGAQAATYYRDRFMPSPRLQAPRTAVCVWGICAETDAEALRLSSSLRMMGTLLARGVLIPVPTVERAVRFLDVEGVPAESLPAGRRILYGSPSTLRRALEEIAAEYGAEEVFVVNIVHEHPARLRSYELIAQECS